MYLATTERSTGSSFAERISSGDVEAHWLIDRERGGAGHGKIGVIAIKAGGTASLMPEANDEDMVFVLRGHGVVRLEGRTADIRDEQVIFIPAGNSTACGSCLFMVAPGMSPISAEDAPRPPLPPHQLPNRRSRAWTK
jgi:mannose-6-phosphate isomerase-like protein (cupin superfamily)